jgi:hypothetical protein
MLLYMDKISEKEKIELVKENPVLETTTRGMMK